MSTFLLGKSSAALTGFDAVGQEATFDTFQNVNRTVDKSIIAHQFREKGEFNYELSFLSDANYQYLFEIVKNRSSLQEGMILLPQPYAENTTTQNACILTPTYNTVQKAYGSYTVFSHPWNNTLGAITKTELTQTQYGYINVNDSNYQDLPGVPFVHSCWLFRFNLNNFLASFGSRELRRLTLAYLGMWTKPIRFFIWSPTYSQWYLIDDRDYYDDSQFAVPAFYLNKQLMASFTLPWGITSMREHFVDGSNEVWIMATPLNEGTPIMCQYVRLFVNGYWVCASDPQDFENFSTSFTGAGRTGTLKLLEM